MKSLPNRPSYDKVDAADRWAQLSSRNDILSKSFTTDLWMKVIQRAIDDVALYKFMRREKKELNEEELEAEFTANAFLFDESHRIPIDDYEVQVKCPKCEYTWTSPMSTIAGSDSICSKCRYKTSWKYTEYELTQKQTVKDISLEELISLWGVEDIIGFRDGCKRKIQEIVEKKLTSTAKTNKKTKKIQKKPKSDKLKVEKKTTLEEICELIEKEKTRLQSEIIDLLEKAKELRSLTLQGKAEGLNYAVFSFSYIQSIIEKLSSKK